jgi:hypothetical protein
MLTKVLKYAGIAALVWIVVRALHPKWYDDLMLRAFASDQLAEPGKTEESKKKFEEAADLAARALLPIGWVLKIAETTSGVTLEQAVQNVKQQVLKMGPPTDTKPETLAQYKKAAIAAGTKGAA